jgi:hypothetical protein
MVQLLAVPRLEARRDFGWLSLYRVAATSSETWVRAVALVVALV